MFDFRSGVTGCLWASFEYPAGLGHGELATQLKSARLAP